MIDLSDKNIRENCPHCNIGSQAYEFPLEATENFYVVCDAHNLNAGHILIIPKVHISCIGAYAPALYEEFTRLDVRVRQFVQQQYGSVAVFEHGIFGQTVYHSHVHYLPFPFGLLEVIPEGDSYCREVESTEALAELLQDEGGYLYFSINDKKYVVDTGLAEPRFFRDRFAKALGVPDRGNWKAMHQNLELMKMASSENLDVQKHWREYSHIM